MSIQNLIDFETRMFATITMEGAQKTANRAEREHEQATKNLMVAIRSKDENKKSSCRKQFSRSLHNFHQTQQNLRKAKQEVARVHLVTVAQ